MSDERGQNQMHHGAHGALPALIVGAAAWLVPGGGHLLLGQRSRGLTIMASIVCLFILGLLIGGVSVIDSPAAVSWSALQQKPWYVVQALGGLMTIFTTVATNGHTLPVSHARSWEIGTLYTAVAGMLNLLALIDACARAAGEPTSPASVDQAGKQA